MKTLRFVILCAFLIAMLAGCKSMGNTNTMTSNSNSSADTNSAASTPKENSIVVTTDGAKYLDGASLPDNNGSMQTAPYASGQRFRLVLRLTTTARSDVRGFTAEAIPANGGTASKASGDVVSYNDNLQIEFPSVPLGSESKLNVWAFLKTGGAPVLVATGKVFVEN